VTISVNPVLATPKFGFPSRVRIIKTDDFSSVFNFRKRISGHYLAIHYQYNSLETPRLGLIVGKKIAKRAVDRNYMKRVLRELFRVNQHDIAPLDLVVRVQRPYGPNDYSPLVDEFGALLRKLGRQVENRKSVS
jgi:ribonuclease P protein component